MYVVRGWKLPEKAYPYQMSEGVKEQVVKWRYCHNSALVLFILDVHTWNTTSNFHVFGVIVSLKSTHGSGGPKQFPEITITDLILFHFNFICFYKFSLQFLKTCCEDNCKLCTYSGIIYQFIFITLPKSQWDMTRANEINTGKQVENYKILYSKIYFLTYENTSIYWVINDSL